MSNIYIIHAYRERKRYTTEEWKILSDPQGTSATAGTCIVSALISITMFLNFFSFVLDENCLDVKPSELISSNTPSLKRGSIGKSPKHNFMLN